MSMACYSSLHLPLEPLTCEGVEQTEILARQLRLRERNPMCMRVRTSRWRSYIGLQVALLWKYVHTTVHTPTANYNMHLVHRSRVAFCTGRT
jgi:hypothetical protein